MASGIVHKAMVYLGLTDDEYEDYEGYEEGGSAPRGVIPSPSRRHPARSPRCGPSAVTPPILPTGSR